MEVNQLAVLKAEYITVYKTLTDERKMREQVFRHDAAKRKAKMREIDQAMGALERIKDMTKALLVAEGAAEPEQPELFGGTNGATGD